MLARTVIMPAAAALVLTYVACGGPSVTDPPQLSGTYELVRANNRRVPTTILGRITIHEGALQLAPDGQFRRTGSFVICGPAEAECTENQIDQSGTWSVSQTGQLTMKYDDPSNGPVVQSFRDSTIYLCGPNLSNCISNLVYIRRGN